MQREGSGETGGAEEESGKRVVPSSGILYRNAPLALDFGHDFYRIAHPEDNLSENP
jgi:hypothetical protein